ncbi:hypothetical protein VTP01DRAFT_3690, partial [Rhizomucor pusillus]|uniref:uncharacterized protein n=1 Tax=Rhizomucor pusillus TaxID=4840 RepID=UPI003744054D
MLFVENTRAAIPLTRHEDAIRIHLILFGPYLSLCVERVRSFVRRFSPSQITPVLSAQACHVHQQHYPAHHRKIECSFCNVNFQCSRRKKAELKSAYVRFYTLGSAEFLCDKSSRKSDI